MGNRRWCQHALLRAGWRLTLDEQLDISAILHFSWSVNSGIECLISCSSSSNFELASKVSSMENYYNQRCAMHGSLKTFALTKERLLTWILLSPSEGKDLKIGEKHFVFKQCRRGVSWQSKLIKSDCFSFETSLKPRTIFSVTCDVFPRQWIRYEVYWHGILYFILWKIPFLHKEDHFPVWSEDKTLRHFIFNISRMMFSQMEMLTSEFQLPHHNVCLCVFLAAYCDIFLFQYIFPFESQHELSSLVCLI